MHHKPLRKTLSSPGETIVMGSAVFKIKPDYLDRLKSPESPEHPGYLRLSTTQIELTIKTNENQGQVILSSDQIGFIVMPLSHNASQALSGTCKVMIHAEKGLLLLNQTPKDYDAQILKEEIDTLEPKSKNQVRKKDALIADLEQWDGTEFKAFIKRIETLKTAINSAEASVVTLADLIMAFRTTLSAYREDVGKLDKPLHKRLEAIESGVNAINSKKPTQKTKLDALKKDFETLKADITSNLEKKEKKAANRKANQPKKVPNTTESGKATTPTEAAEPDGPAKTSPSIKKISPKEKKAAIEDQLNPEEQADWSKISKTPWHECEPLNTQRSGLAFGTKTDKGVARTLSAVASKLLDPITTDHRKLVFKESKAVPKVGSELDKLPEEHEYDISNILLPAELLSLEVMSQHVSDVTLRSCIIDLLNRHIDLCKASFEFLYRAPVERQANLISEFKFLLHIYRIMDSYINHSRSFYTTLESLQGPLKTQHKTGDPDVLKPVLGMLIHAICFERFLHDLTYISLSQLDGAEFAFKPVGTITVDTLYTDPIRIHHIKTGSEKVSSLKEIAEQASEALTGDQKPRTMKNLRMELHILIQFSKSLKAILPAPELASLHTMIRTLYVVLGIDNSHQLNRVLSYSREEDYKHHELSKIMSMLTSGLMIYCTLDQIYRGSMVNLRRSINDLFSLTPMNIGFLADNKQPTGSELEKELASTFSTFILPRHCMDIGDSFKHILRNGMAHLMSAMHTLHEFEIAEKLVILIDQINKDQIILDTNIPLFENHLKFIEECLKRSKKYQLIRTEWLETFQVTDKVSARKAIGDAIVECSSRINTCDGTVDDAISESILILSILAAMLHSKEQFKTEYDLIHLLKLQIALLRNLVLEGFPVLEIPEYVVSSELGLLKEALVKHFPTPFYQNSIRVALCDASELLNELDERVFKPLELPE